MNPEAYRSLCRLRSTLEGFALGQLVAHPRRKAIFRSLERRLKSLKMSAHKGDYDQFHAADIAFHAELIASAEMPTLRESWEAVMRATDAEVLLVKKQLWPNLTMLYREHEYLLAAWKGVDLAVAERATHQHLEMGWHRLAAAVGLPEENNAVERVVAFLSTHCAEKIEMEWVARHVGFTSLRHLNRRFHDHLNMPPHAWLKQFRLERAAQMLANSNESVAHIAQRNGYPNASHFIREFRKHFQCTPLHYQQQRRK